MIYVVIFRDDGGRENSNQNYMQHILIWFYFVVVLKSKTVLNLKLIVDQLLGKMLLFIKSKN